MTAKRPGKLWEVGAPLPDAEYAALFANVSHDELALFAANVCKRVVDFRFVGEMKRPPKVALSHVTEPLLVRTLERLDKAVYAKQARLNAKPGVSRRTVAWSGVGELYERHRAKHASRASFVRFALGEIKDCPDLRTVDRWVKSLDEQHLAR